MNNKITAFFISLLVSWFPLHEISAQKPDLDWVRPISGAGGTIITSSLIVDHEENVYAVGSFRDSIELNTKSGVVTRHTKGSIDMFVAKIDPSGTVDWIKSIGGNGAMGTAGGGDLHMTYWFDITLDKSANLYISGCFRDTVDFDPGSGQAVKTTPSYWSPGPGRGDPPVKSFYENSFILKLNKDGEFVWVRTLYGNGNAAGGIAVDHNEGTVSITGYYKDTVDFNNQKGTSVLTTIKGAQNAFVAKFDTSGNFKWVKEMGMDRKVSSHTDRGTAIHIDNSGYIYVTGTHNDSADYDPGPATAYLVSYAKSTNSTFVLKLDAGGNYIWAKSMGSTSDHNPSSGFGIATDGKGNVYTTGFFQVEGSFDPEHNPANNLPGSTPSFISAFLSKLDSNGRYVWARVFDRPSSVNAIDNGLSVQTDEGDNVYFTGYFAGEIYLDPDTANTCRELFETGRGNSISDVFAVKLDEDGSFLWGKQFKTLPNPPGTSAGASTGKHIELSSGNNYMYLSGAFVGTTDFNYEGVPHIINSANANAQGEDGFVARFVYDFADHELAVEVCGHEYELLGESYYTSGHYVQKVRNSAGCDSIIYLNLTLNPPPAPVINVNGFVLGISSSYPNGSYQWIYNDEEIPGATDSTYTVTKNGFYRVVVTTDKGCVDTSDAYEVKNVTSITDNASIAGTLKIYPNPATDVVHIASPVDIDIRLTDVAGKALEVKESAKTFSVRHLPSGIYFLRIFNKAGELLKVEKIIR